MKERVMEKQVKWETVAASELLLVSGGIWDYSTGWAQSWAKCWRTKTMPSTLVCWTPPRTSTPPLLRRVRDGFRLGSIPHATTNRGRACLPPLC